MNLNELILRLGELRDEMGGETEVRVESDYWCSYSAVGRVSADKERLRVRGRRVTRHYVLVQPCP